MGPCRHSALTTSAIALLAIITIIQPSTYAYKWHEDDFDMIRGVAEFITSPGGIERIKQASAAGASPDDFDLLAPTNPNGRRRLGATDEECGAFLAASLAPSLWECFDMAQTVLSLVSTENCKTTYDFTPSNMQRICTNQCNSVLDKTLTTMSQAGCSAAILKQSCSECSSGEKCVGTKCRTVCSPTLPCPCSYNCENGACIPPQNSEVQLNNMGVNGFRLSLEYLCTTSPTSGDYCFADIFNVLDSVDASTFCSQMQPLGCCTGTVFNYVTGCATSNDTLSTSVGTISLTDLQQFCPEVDFHTSCSNAPEIAPGACLDTFYLSGAWTTRASFLTMAVASLAVLAAQYLL